MEKWKVTYAIDGTFYSELVKIPTGLTYLNAAQVAMDKVITYRNNNDYTDMSAQMVD